jgi:hypothetical protein
LNVKISNLQAGTIDDVATASVTAFAKPRAGLKQPGLLPQGLKGSAVKQQRRGQHG